jgi:hypothetical protein
MRLILVIVLCATGCLYAKTNAATKPPSQPAADCQAITAFGKRCKNPAVKNEIFCRQHLNQRKKKDEQAQEYPESMVEWIEESHTIQQGTNGVFVVDETGLWIRLAGIASDNRTLPFIQAFCGTNRVVCEYDELETKSKGRRVPATAYIRVRDQILNVELIRNGLAGWDPATCSQRYHDAFEAAENEARKNKRGFWSE